MQCAHDLSESTRLLVRRAAAISPCPRNGKSSGASAAPGPPRKNKSRRRLQRQRAFSRSLILPLPTTSPCLGPRFGLHAQSISTAGPVDVAPTSASRAVTALSHTIQALRRRGPTPPARLREFPCPRPTGFADQLQFLPHRQRRRRPLSSCLRRGPKISTAFPQCGHQMAHVSTTPSTSTFTWREHLNRLAHIGDPPPATASSPPPRRFTATVWINVNCTSSPFPAANQLPGSPARPTPRCAEIA